MQEACDAVVAGHICLDIIPSIASSGFCFSPGHLFEIGPAILSTGGPVSNTGLALHKLGIATRLMGKVGTDFFGQSILRIITGFGTNLAQGMVTVPGETSSYTIILSPPDADRMFLHCPGCNDRFGAEDVDHRMTDKSRLFHFGYPPLLRRVIENGGAGLVEILRRAKSGGVTTSLDLCMPDPKGFAGSVDWKEILGAALRHVDIFMPSLEETLITLYPEKYRQLVAGPGGVLSGVTPHLLSSIGSDLIGMGPAIAGLKLGAQGLYLRTGDKAAWRGAGRACPGDDARWCCREIWSPCFQVSVAGTTGAGDATIAGFLAALLKGRSPEECVTMACAVGGCNVESADALGGLLDWDATCARIDGGWPRSELGAAAAGWGRISAGGLRLGPLDRRP
jgi:sugar/nucleoside kinase (ribokinase family)